MGKSQVVQKISAEERQKQLLKVNKTTQNKKQRDTPLVRRERLERKATSRKKPKQFVTGPRYSENGQGKRMTVTLGSAVMLGSVPMKSACTVVHRLKEVEFGGQHWKKGHLLCNELGGRGTDQNLTPLTGRANRAHSSQVEEHIKKALTRYKTLEENEFPNHWLCIEYTVQVVGTKKSTRIKSNRDLLKFVPKMIKCSATTVFYDAHTGKKTNKPDGFKGSDLISLNVTVKNSVNPQKVKVFIDEDAMDED